MYIQIKYIPRGYSIYLFNKLPQRSIRVEKYRIYVTPQNKEEKMFKILFRQEIEITNWSRKKKNPLSIQRFAPSDDHRVRFNSCFKATVCVLKYVFSHRLITVE